MIKSPFLPLDLLSKGQIFHSIILLLLVVLLSKNESGNILAVIVENNPFYGLSTERINFVENLTNDKLIKVKVEYAPAIFDENSPEYFRVTLYYTDSNQAVLHADTDILISKNGNEIFKESNEYSQPFVHTPNGIVLSSFNFPEVGEYLITVQVLGINFMPIVPKQANFTANISGSGEGYGINMTTENL
jgi:hypothetical protein